VKVKEGVEWSWIEKRPPPVSDLWHASAY